jgi:hypothetical protein
MESIHRLERTRTTMCSMIYKSGSNGRLKSSPGANSNSNYNCNYNFGSNALVSTPLSGKRQMSKPHFNLDNQPATNSYVSHRGSSSSSICHLSPQVRMIVVASFLDRLHGQGAGRPCTNRPWLRTRFNTPDHTFITRFCPYVLSYMECVTGN